MENRYLPIKLVRYHNNQFLPFWDERIMFKTNDEEYEPHQGSYVDKENPYIHLNTIDGAYDMVTKQVVPTIKFDYYPEIDNFNIGQQYLIENVKQRAYHL